MVGTPIDQVRRLINQGLIKDLISPLLSVDLWNDERAGKKGGAAGNRTLGPLWFRSRFPLQSTILHSYYHKQDKPVFYTLESENPTFLTTTINNPTQLLSQTRQTWLSHAGIREPNLSHDYASGEEYVYIRSEFEVRSPFLDLLLVLRMQKPRSCTFYSNAFAGPVQGTQAASAAGGAPLNYKYIRLPVA